MKASCSCPCAGEQHRKDEAPVDITSMAKKAGFLYPVVLTSAVWGLVEPSAGAKGQSIHWRLRDLLTALGAAVKYQSAGNDRIRFPVIFDDRPVGKYRAERLSATFRFDDDWKPVITIMREGEDGPGSPPNP